MTNYRIPLLLSLYLSSWSIPAYSLQRSTILSSSLTEKMKIQTIAQAPSPQTPESEQLLDISPPSSDYDRHMQAGYQATREQNYQTALEEFSKALKARPNDIYAQQAIQNMETYLLRQQKAKYSQLGWILFGLMVTLVGLGGSIWIIRRLLHRRKTLDPLSEKEHKDQVKNVFFQEFPAKTDDQLDNDPIPSSQPRDISDDALPVQATTRIPNLDLIEELIKNLESPDPKIRRKSIWKLAQQSDSRAMKPLVDKMIDSDSYERSLVLEALSQISTRTLRPMNQALAISLQDKNPQVRKNAIRDLTRIYDVMSQISQMLCHAIDDSDEEVQETAVWALNQLNMQMPVRPDLIPRNQDKGATRTAEVEIVEDTES